MIEMSVRTLCADDAVLFQQLRLSGLQESPTAFSSSYEEEHDRSSEQIAAWLSVDDHGAVFGAWTSDHRLIGVTGVTRERQRKLSHKAFLWGVHVEPQFRRNGVGRSVTVAALAYAFDTLRVRQVNLGVHSRSGPAIRLYESLGFEAFGIEKGFMCVDGQLQDEMHMVCNRQSPATAV